MSLTLYGFDGSTYVRTVKILLVEKDAGFDQVPVIDHDGFRVIETGAIVAYLDEVLPGPSITPDNAHDRARTHMAQGIYDSYGYGNLVQVFGYHLFPDFIGGQNEDSRRKGIENSKRVLRELMKIKGTDPYIAGLEPSIGDFYLAPGCAYIAMTPDAPQVFSVDGFDGWWKRMQSLPNFKATQPK
ncbi:glutathione S-transferase family protein [Pseudomonas sp. ZB1P45]|uniref:glutathione S-transferase family protein n=1 Tax=Pseudomonas frigoris TaxID=3398356 RepID=UPI0039EE8B4B